MKIAIIGGGPGGLYAAILLRRVAADHEVTVWERNAPDDTFGFGVVFSDETLTAFEAADPPSYARITESFARWSEIDIHYRGVVERSGGHGFAAIGRVRLLQILRERTASLGAEIRFLAEAPPVDLMRSEYDLVVAADGANSQIRRQLAETFGARIDVRPNKFMWLGTDRVFTAFTFAIVETKYGVFQVHAYPYDHDMSTFIVETDEATWRRSGLDRNEQYPLAPGENDRLGIAFAEETFAPLLDGHGLVANNSKWLNFQIVRNQRWQDGEVVLLGDAAHTAHWSIGSGTKLAMEDAIALAWALRTEHVDLAAALATYEGERQPVVASLTRAAQASLEWFEDISQYIGQESEQFAFNLLTRSRRITYNNLRVRDSEFVDRVDRAFAAKIDGADDEASRRPPRPPMFLPFKLRELELANRVVVSPMDMYLAENGTVGDFHLVHLGARAVGGAGLVMTEMICTSAEGRITPGCGGLYRDEHILGWRRIVDFVHASSCARIGAQIGHSGRKGATKLMWEGMDEPLDAGAWPLLAPSAVPYFAHSQVPREMTRADMDAVREEFVATAQRAEAAGFDLLELHMAHGYLLSSFLSPLTNRREDGYGGVLANRARFPLEIFAACREVWPEHKPMSVRISATDWYPGGFAGEDAVFFSEMLRDAGCDVVDVSSGQVWPEQMPAFGRSYQTPFADRIRQQVGIPTIAVGAISSYEDVNTIILAGRADLCALGRPHLYDPYWTLHAAAMQDCTDVTWIDSYKAGSRRPNDGTREAARAAPRSFVAPQAPDDTRWLSRRESSVPSTSPRSTESRTR
jgi:anthraniloyl-CoA monooxygenase